MISIVDTDVLVGLVDKNDALHKKAKYITEKLASLGVESALLPTTLGEFVTLATIRIGRIQTQKAVNELLQEGFIHIDITEELTQEALVLYQQQTSKEESLSDCFVMVAAQKFSADFILSFDSSYTKNGFLLAEDFLISSSSLNR